MNGKKITVTSTTVIAFALHARETFSGKALASGQFLDWAFRARATKDFR
jgi:hypothetical protein